MIHNVVPTCLGEHLNMQHRQGNDCVQTGPYANAEGQSTTASGSKSHAEGNFTQALGDSSHAEGDHTIASGDYSHAEGTTGVASGYASHAEGQSTAPGDYAHAEGLGTTASGTYSHAQNLGTKAEYANQTVMGKYNASDASALLIVGNGTYDGARSNAFTVSTDGAVVAKRFNGHSLKSNASIAAQTPTAATRTYVVGTGLTFLTTAWVAGAMFRFEFDMTKTAAGTAASTIDVCFGTTGTTADTAHLSFTKPAGTAVVDCGKVVINVTIRNTGASAVAVGHMTMTHNLASTGHATIPVVDQTVVSSAFNLSTAKNIGVCITTGASDAITIQMASANSWNI